MGAPQYRSELCCEADEARRLNSISSCRGPGRLRSTDSHGATYRSVQRSDLHTGEVWSRNPTSNAYMGSHTETAGWCQRTRGRGAAARWAHRCGIPFGRTSTDRGECGGLHLSGRRPFRPNGRPFVRKSQGRTGSLWRTTDMALRIRFATTTANRTCPGRSRRATSRMPGNTVKSGCWLKPNRRVFPAIYAARRSDRQIPRNTGS